MVFGRRYSSGRGPQYGGHVKEPARDTRVPRAEQARLLWPHTCPTYGALWSWCGYCGRPTQDVGSVEDGGAQWRCHPWAEWAQILRPGVVKGAFVLMPKPGSGAHGHLAPQ
jgi:hypothetical protein